MVIHQYLTERLYNFIYVENAPLDVLQFILTGFTIYGI